MNTEKWDEIISNSNHLTKPARVSQLFNSTDIEKFSLLIAKVMVEFARQGKPANGLKCFLDGKFDISTNERFVADPPDKSQGIEDWAKEFFHEVPFGMIMNFLENYSNELVQEVGIKVRPLLNRVGFPFSGLSLLFFMGDYGYTPFGAHKGTPGEDGFLCHLGPADKVFYTWETDVYYNLTGGVQGYQDLDKILAYATEHILKPGDVMFIPSDVYHVANTKDFSISLILDFRRATHEMVKKTLVKNLTFTQQDLETYIELLVDFNSLDPAISFSSNIEEAYKKHLCILRSNGGFLTPSVSQKIVLNWECSFSIKEPFRIIEYAFESKKVYFARGHEISVSHDSIFSQIIDQLNAGRTVGRKTIESFGVSIYRSDLIALFSQLLQADILEIKT